jgi:hypothetical protein
MPKVRSATFEKRRPGGAHHEPRGSFPMKPNLLARQAKMKARIQREKTANNRLHTMGWGQARLAQCRRQPRRPARIIERPKNFRSLRSEADSGSETHREHLLKRKDFISAKTIVDDTFLTNIPTGESAPPDGEQWEYYVFALLVTKHAGKRGPHEIHTKYIETLSGPTRDAVEEQLLELVTRPGIKCAGLNQGNPNYMPYQVAEKS